MGWLSGLGEAFAPGAAANMHAKAGALQDYLAADSPYWKSGDLQLATPGSQGNALVNAAAQVGAQNVSANFTPIDQDAAALAALSDQYYQQFLHGGKAEAAARNRAVSSSADAGGGGLEGVKALQTASQQLSGQAEQTSLQERGNAGAQANENALQAGMLALRKRTLQAAVTHANIQKGIAAQSMLNNLQNQQSQNDLRLQSGAISAQHSLNSGQLNVDAANNQTALGLLGAAGGAAATATALGTQYATKSVDVPQVSDAEITNAANAKLQAYGITPPVTQPVPALTGQGAAQATQDALIKALGTGSAKISYPTLQSTATSVLSDPSSYPLTTSMRS